MKAVAAIALALLSAVAAAQTQEGKLDRRHLAVEVVPSPEPGASRLVIREKTLELANLPIANAQAYQPSFSGGALLLNAAPTAHHGVYWHAYRVHFHKGALSIVGIEWQDMVPATDGARDQLWTGGSIDLVKGRATLWGRIVDPEDLPAFQRAVEHFRAHHVPEGRTSYPLRLHKAPPLRLADFDLTGPRPFPCAYVDERLHLQWTQAEGCLE
ncbi:hypothetical protein HHL11_13480 [Ramlibacter sp. G-1-2-2]|uniref:Uncharacterized protein n=1 Tax=Ramlibacter agri TaxID=2728837 RepID=A0A848H1S3_9BURK|nr:hypothetical protein [Ramlibacter agri]NML44765.1 hypothetical protein [Ramlibacter agri]